MKLKEVLKKIQDDQKFKEWEKENKDAYLSYAFCNIENNNRVWQIGYYLKQKDRIITFCFDNELKISPEEEVFKKPDMHVNKIDIDGIKMDLDHVLEKTDDFQKKNFPKELPVKKIIILQNLEKLGNIWNITYITQSFKTLNMKVDSEDGKILDHKLSSIFDFKQE